MSSIKLMPRAKAYCDECFQRATDRGLTCPFMKWDGRFCEQIEKISSMEKRISYEIDNAPLTGRLDFKPLFKAFNKEVDKLSLENCFRNGRLPQNMPEVL